MRGVRLACHRTDLPMDNTAAGIERAACVAIPVHKEAVCNCHQKPPLPALKSSIAIRAKFLPIERGAECTTIVANPTMTFEKSRWATLH